MATSIPVEVVGVTSHGENAEAGTVDIRPLVNQVDGAGNAVDHGTIFGCPYVRLQGGGNAIIMDPQVGDHGVAVFAMRDISSVVANRGQANPGSQRAYDWADGVYLGGFLNEVATQWVRFYDGGIEVKSTGKVDVTAASTVNVNAASAVNITAPQCVVTGNLSVSTGATGSFTTPTGNIVTVQDGIVTNIA